MSKVILASGTFSEKLIILVDIDQTIAGFDQELFNRWKNRWPHIPIPDRRTYTYSNIEDYQRMQMIAGETGFFESLPIYSGAAEKLNEWQQSPYIEVFLCTKPLDKRHPCIVEKYKWIEKNLGSQWKDKVIITNDKTLCFGHLLIDDLPTQSGIKSSPSWIHIYFNQLYNNTENGAPNRPRINNWNDVFIIINNNEWCLVTD